MPTVPSGSATVAVVVALLTALAGPAPALATATGSPAATTTAVGNSTGGTALSVASTTASVPNYTERVNFSDDDSVAPEVPRNGTVLRLDVETGISETGERQNATVTLEVPDSDAPGDPQNITGEWLNATAGGENDTVVSIDDRGDSITVTTGDDGVASVFYRTDRSAVDLENDACPEVSAPDDACIRAYLADDPSVQDNTSIDFVGTVEPEPASLSGLVTNDREQPVAGATVWVGRVAFAGGLVLTAEPDDPADPAEFTLRLYDGTVEAGNLLDEATVPADRLRQGGDGYTFQDIARISADEGYALWTTSRGSPTPGAYTLSNVPASNSTTAATTYAVEGAFRVAGGDLLQGRASSVRTTKNATGTGNVVLQGAEQAVLAVSGLSTPDAASAGETIPVGATVTNTGGISGAGEVVWRLDANGDGDYDDPADPTVVLGTVSLDPGTSATVSGDLTVPEGLAGTVTHGAFTDDDSRTADLAIASTDECPDLADRVEDYAGADCAVDTGELRDAIGDWAAGDVSTATLRDVITAWAAS